MLTSENQPCVVPGPSESECPVALVKDADLEPHLEPTDSGLGLGIRILN